MTIEQFIKLLAQRGIELSKEQCEQFQIYYQLLVEWNKKMNLTSIVQIEEVYLKHFFDSVMLLWMAPIEMQEATLIDVGAGAGFPSVPLKIVRPDLKVTIVDSLNKRIQFLELLCQELGLSDVTPVHARAEELGQNVQYRQQFDIATARAVAPLNVLCEYCLPFVKKGGEFIAMKSTKVEEEVHQAQKAIKVLGAKLLDVTTTTLPGEESERAFVRIKKTLETPNKYPRRAGKPTKQPIV